MTCRRTRGCWRAARRSPADAFLSARSGRSASASPKALTRPLASSRCAGATCVTGPLAEPVVGDAFAYRHALLRDAGYASLARAERARLHARLARWLEGAAGDRSDEVAEAIAGHYARRA